METVEGQLLARDEGTPQGGVVSPLLANLFLHYAFDLWVTRHLPSVRFCPVRRRWRDPLQERDAGGIRA